MISYVESRKKRQKSRRGAIKENERNQRQGMWIMWEKYDLGTQWNLLLMTYDLIYKLLVYFLLMHKIINIQGTPG